MKTLNLNENSEYNYWGILPTGKVKKIALGNKSVEYDVYKIPVDILVYNATNGRIFIEARRFEFEEDVKLVQLRNEDPSKYNDEIENIIWKTNEEKNNSTKRDISIYGQMEPGVVLHDGTIIDGNRRFTCLRKLHREFPEKDEFKYFEAAIVKVDGINITRKLLKEYEIKVQFGTDEKVDYNVINKSMHIYYAIEKNEDTDFNYNTMAELLGNGTKASDIAKLCKVCALIDEFLVYIKKDEEYQIAEDLKIYWPLETLVQYFSKNGSNLSELQKLERKNLFFDYLLTLNVPLITQTLRDNLLKHIFKDENATTELIDKHNKIIGNDINELINKEFDSETLLQKFDELRNSEKSELDKEEYERIKERFVINNQIDLPLKLAKDALKNVEDIELKALTDAMTEIAEEKLSQIKDYIDKIINKSNSLLNEIEKHEQTF